MDTRKVKISLFGKIIGLILMTTVLVGGVVFSVNDIIVRQGLGEQGVSDMRETAQYVQRYINDQRVRATLTAEVLAKRPDVIQAVEKMDKAAVKEMSRGYVKARQVSFITIADRDGNVVGRGHSDKDGDSVLGQENVKKSLAGQTSSGIEEGTVIKFSLRAGHPIVSGGRTIGSVTTGTDLATDAMVDEIKRLYGVECTVFQGDTRVATTIVQDGKRAVGTKMDNPKVIDSVLRKGEIFFDVNKILGKTYEAAYYPLKNVDGKVAGMFFIGKDRELTEKTIRSMVLPSLGATVLIAVVMTVLGVLLVIPIIRTLNRVIGGLSQSYEEVSDASTHVAGSSQELAEGASEQAASIEETSASLEELAATTEKNADNARQAKEMMAETRRIVKKVNDHMEEMQQAISEITKTSEETSKIIKTIDEIAFQTNLLALNAAVEAARAGEAGAGFAIVAGEVRSLAGRAAEAAKSTNSLIENTIKAVMNGSELTQITQKAFQENIGIAEKVNQLVDEVASASREQAIGISQVNQAVAQMDKVVQQSAANAEESASASEELKAQAAQMKVFVEELQLIVLGTASRQNSEKSVVRMR